MSDTWIYCNWTHTALVTKQFELKHFFHKHRIRYSLLQEDKLKQKSMTPKLPGYTKLRLDCPYNDGSLRLITPVHKNLHFPNTTALTLAQRPLDNTLEWRSIPIQIHQKPYNLFKVYIPPLSSYQPQYTPTLDNLTTTSNTSALGDFNSLEIFWPHKTLTEEVISSLPN